LLEYHQYGKVYERANNSQMLIIKAKLTNIYVKINSKSGGFYVKKKRRGFIL
jgi:hypothetical protein